MFVGGGERTVFVGGGDDLRTSPSETPVFS